MSDKYILDEKGDVVEANSLLEWAEWVETAGEKKRVAYDEVTDYYVSTVFLALDYSFGGIKPILFETMAFEKKPTTEEVMGKKMTYNKDIGMSERYHTKEEALEGHKRIVEEIKTKYENKEA